jgi:hypothetical protein
MVARAIKRRGDDPTNWSVADADVSLGDRLRDADASEALKLQ